MFSSRLIPAAHVGNIFQEGEEFVHPGFRGCKQNETCVPVDGGDLGKPVVALDDELEQRYLFRVDPDVGILEFHVEQLAYQTLRLESILPISSRCFSRTGATISSRNSRDC